MLLNAIKREKAKWEIRKYTRQRKSMSIIYKKFLQVNNRMNYKIKKKDKLHEQEIHKDTYHQWREKRVKLSRDQDNKYKLDIQVCFSKQ